MLLLAIVVGLLVIAVVGYLLYVFFVGSRQVKDFAALTRGQRLVYEYNASIGVDDSILYVVGFSHLVDGVRVAAVPPSRFGLHHITWHELTDVAGMPEIVITIEGGDGEEFSICSSSIPRSKIVDVYRQLAPRISPPEPANQRNSGSPMAALLRTLAVTEHDARTYEDNLERVAAQEGGNSTYLLRRAADPVVFELDWKVGPDTEPTLRNLFTKWSVPVRFHSMEDANMPDLLMSVGQAADANGLKLWLIDSMMDMYIGFLTPKDRAERVVSLCKECEIPLLN